jgi:crotonobetainyl-CoA:carnitine CoA-transferase CaiB-like acyl-CoA transferase
MSDAAIEARISEPVQAWNTPDAAANGASAALAGIRVLDLSGLAGQYCGKQFADLGADVILVEPVGGSSVRREGPFLDDRAHAEFSLQFAYFNAGKRGISVDLDRPEGQQIMRQLARDADLIIESEKPGLMERRGLGYASLVASNPKLVMTSVTPFGQTGPYANYEAEDIVALALGGLLYLGGYPDTSPIAAYGNQAYLAAAQFASVASMMALLAADEGAETTGRHVDVSIQECVTMGLETAIQFYDLEKTVRKRASGEQIMAGVGVFACTDGQIYLMAGGIASTRFWENLVNWLVDEGVDGARQLLEPAWESHDYLSTPEAKTIFRDLFAPFAEKHTKAYLYQTGQSRRIPICPINTPRDILTSRQLEYRSFFVSQKHTASGRMLTVPGAPYQLQETPWRQHRPAPRLGEHTSEILAGLGYDAAARAALLKSGVIN